MIGSGWTLALALAVSFSGARAGWCDALPGPTQVPVEVEDPLAGPSLITLDVTDAPLNDVIAAIAKQSGVVQVEVKSGGGRDAVPDETVTLKVDRQPFWKVMQELLPPRGLILRDNVPPGHLVIWHGKSDSMAGPTSMSGPFMAIATRVKDSREIAFDRPGKKQPSQTSIGVTFYVEPKVPLIGHEYNPVIQEFVDDGGHSLIYDGPPALPIRFDFRASAPKFGAAIPVADVEGRTKRIAKLKGFVRAYVRTKTGRLVIPDVFNARGASERAGPWRLTVDDVRPGWFKLSGEVAQPPGAEAKVAAHRRAAFWPWLDPNSGFKLVGQDGRETRLRSGNGSASRAGGWQYEFQIEPDGLPPVEPAKLVWEFAADWKAVEIPFEFTDLPLP
jgi:hypothetical protein